MTRSDRIKKKITTLRAFRTKAEDEYLAEDVGETRSILNFDRIIELDRIITRLEHMLITEPQ